MTNIVLLVGNVGQDPQVRTTMGGATITSISVATSRKYRNSGEQLVEETEWHRVTCFNGIGKNVAQYVAKGMKVAVEGRLHYTKWTAQDGTDRYGVEIYADKVDFLTKAPAADAPAPEETPAPRSRSRAKKPAMADADMTSTTMCRFDSALSPAGFARRGSFFLPATCIGSCSHEESDTRPDGPTTAGAFRCPWPASGQQLDRR